MLGQGELRQDVLYDLIDAYPLISFLYPMNDFQLNNRLLHALGDSSSELLKYSRGFICPLGGSLYCFKEVKIVLEVDRHLPSSKHIN